LLKLDTDTRNGKKNKKIEFKSEPKITTGEILELLDGISETEDRIIIFTTNYPGNIDKAFLWGIVAAISIFVIIFANCGIDSRV
jgi:hypothetical protein